MRSAKREKENEMKEANKNLLAETYGIAAFEMDKPCIPALDSNLAQLLEGLKVGEGAISLLQSWHRGWTKANLSAPVDF
jgi:hypothetical protein